MSRPMIKCHEHKSVSVKRVDDMLNEMFFIIEVGPKREKIER
jgi:hypothetical protein